MRSLVVVENTARWPLQLEGAEVISARAYVTDDQYADLRRTVVFNLCRRYGYQSLGYYVSLLAQARGHRPLPSVATLQSLGNPGMIRRVSDDLDELIQRSLRPLRSQEFILSIYFGRNMAKRYDSLSRALFNEFRAPFLKARFVQDGGRWRLAGIGPVATAEITDDHRAFVIEQAQRFFRRPPGPPPEENLRYDLAILWRDDDPTAPSNARAIRRFIRAAREHGIRAEVIGPEEVARIAEFDALFIRETTAVEHRTYRLARRAQWEGMVVIDDPESIIRCSNKVFQAEVFRRGGLPTPKTMVVHEGNLAAVAAGVGFPCVVKRPDGCFSQGVLRIDSLQELESQAPGLFRESDLLIAQAWTPSSFDWRIGILEGKPLYACRYHMAPGHWQIVQGHYASDSARFGRVEPVSLEEVPSPVLTLAQRAAALIGGGLYGVDLKEVESGPVVMEVNDNPNIDGGLEDGIIGDRLYSEILRVFRRRLDERGGRTDLRG